MTEEELTQTPFRFQCHMSTEYEHTTTHFSNDGRIGFCDHMPFKDGEPHGRSYRHYMIDGKVYKSKEKFIKALKSVL